MIKTYEEILSSMQNEFKTLAGFDADDASDIGIRLKVLAGAIFSEMTNLNWLKKQMFPQTATAEQLDLHAQQRGITRKSATKARGVLTFSRLRIIYYDITIPAGTVCATPGADGLRYVTLEPVTLSSDTLSVDVAAEAESAGAEFNTLAETITVMVTPPTAVTAVKNKLAFIGGSDQESDEELRARLIESYRNIPNGTNAAFYRDCALKYNDVYSASAVPRARGDGTVDVYVAAKGGVLSSTRMQAINKDLSALKEVNVDVKVKAPDTVSRDVTVYLYPKDGYTFSDISDECKSVINNYFASLKIGQPFLLAELGSYIFNIEGVKNYRFYSSSSDYNADNDELICSGNITVAEGS